MEPKKARLGDAMAGTRKRPKVDRSGKVFTLDENTYSLSTLEGHNAVKERRKKTRRERRLALSPKEIKRLQKEQGDIHKPLSRREQNFVKILTTMDGMITKREAAVQAGYPTASAHVRASELLSPIKNPHVCRAIEEARAEIDDQFKVTRTRHQKDLWRIRELAIREGNYGAAVSAEVARGKSEGTIYVQKTEVRTGTIDSMSREEVETRLADLKGRVGALDDDETPTESQKAISDDT